MACGAAGTPSAAAPPPPCRGDGTDPTYSGAAPLVGRRRRPPRKPAWASPRGGRTDRALHVRTRSGSPRDDGPAQQRAPVVAGEVGARPRRPPRTSLRTSVTRSRIPYASSPPGGVRPAVAAQTSGATARKPAPASARVRGQGPRPPGSRGGAAPERRPPVRRRGTGSAGRWPRAELSVICRGYGRTRPRGRARAPAANEDGGRHRERARAGRPAAAPPLPEGRRATAGPLPAQHEHRTADAREVDGALLRLRGQREAEQQQRGQLGFGGSQAGHPAAEAVPPMMSGRHAGKRATARSACPSAARSPRRRRRAPEPAMCQPARLATPPDAPGPSTTCMGGRGGGGVGEGGGRSLGVSRGSTCPARRRTARSAHIVTP